jgi:hypothetical protein
MKTFPAGQTFRLWSTLRTPNLTTIWAIFALRAINFSTSEQGRARFFCFLSYFVLYWDDFVLSRSSSCRSIFPFPVLGRVS